MISAKNAAHHAGNAGFVDFGFGGRFGATARYKLREDLASGIFTVSDACHQVVDFAEAVIGGGAQHGLIFDFLQSDAVFAGFFLDELASDFDSAFALVHVEPMLDLVARARRLSEREPVAAGLVSGLCNDFAK